MELNPENRALCLICLLPLSSLISLSLSPFPPRLSQGHWHRWRPWGRRTTVCAVSWTPTGTRWSCWSRSRVKLILLTAKKTRHVNNSSASCNKRCRACKRCNQSHITHTHHTLFLNHDESARPDLNLESDTHIKLDINNPDTQQAFNTCNKIKRLGITVLCLLFNRVLCSECKTPGGDYSNEPLIPTYQG